MMIGKLNKSPEDSRRPVPMEVTASGKTAERRPSSIGFREGERSDDTVSEISDGHEWFYETICSKFDEGGVPSTIQEYRSRAKNEKRKKAAARRKAPVPPAGTGTGGVSTSRSSIPQHQTAAPAGEKPFASELEPTNIDDVLAENFQLKEINKSVWRELQSLRQRSRKEKEEANQSRRTVRSAAGSIESLQQQLATSLSLVESMERDKEANENKIQNLQKMVADLTEKLASTTDDLKAARQENTRKSRQVASLENSVKISGRDLDRTRKSLKDKIRKTICMELEIETLQEDLKDERASHAGSSRNVQPGTTDRLHGSTPSGSHNQSDTPTPLEHKIGSCSDRRTSIPSSLLEAKLNAVLEEQETTKARYAQEKKEMEARHRSQLRKVREEAEAEKDQLLRQMNSMEQMLLNRNAAETEKSRYKTSSTSQSAKASASSKSLDIQLRKSISPSDRRHHAVSAKGSNGNVNSSKSSKTFGELNTYLSFTKGIRRISPANDERQESPIQTPDLSEPDANNSRISKSKPTKPSRPENPQQDSMSTVQSVKEISELVRDKALAA